MRERLEKFYADSFAKGLKIRTTKKNVILYLVQGDVRKVISKFDISFAPDSNETTVGLARRLADACKDAVISHLVAVEMAKMDDATPPPVVYIDKEAPWPLEIASAPAKILEPVANVEDNMPTEELQDSLKAFLGG